MSRSLFILKKRNSQDYSDYMAGTDYSNTYQAASGMYNSAKFVVDDLIAGGQEAAISIVEDNNRIDTEVTRYRPTHVFIEGLWVVPEKFAVLRAIHPTVTWIVRIHSEIPFIATEGVAFEWITKYLLDGVAVAPNAPRAHQQVRWYAKKILESTIETKRITDARAELLTPFLPNCYPLDFLPYSNADSDSDVLDIGCFGAFRPLKNHLQQAFVALKYAQDQGKRLRFHVNARQDAGGMNPFRNVQAVIEGAGQEFVLHEWENRETFLNSLSQLDVLLQVSISETFNIVAADATLVGIPILVSDEIEWTFPTRADPQDADDCLKKLKLIMFSRRFFITGNRAGLTVYAKSSKRKWLRFIGN